VAAGLTEAVRDAVGALTAELAWEPGLGGTTLRVEVRHDGPSLVRTVRVHTRVGEGEWTQHDERSVTVEHPEGAVVAAYVELLGARGVLLARQGTLEEPVLHGAPPAPIVVALPEPSEVTDEPVAVEVPVQATQDGSDDLVLAVGLGVGAAALVATGVVLALVFGTQASGQTQPTTPLVVGF